MSRITSPSQELYIPRITYLEVMDAVADCRDTMMQLLHNLQQQFIMGQSMKWLVLEGDAKLFEIVKVSIWGGTQLGYSISW